jgi:N-acylneuraminate cytidylyltransferase
MSAIAIIPARGGSKRIPRKNIKPFHGQPMISYSIRAAIDSGLFEWVIVSTDDAEIAEVATHYGAEIPFLRPKELADDHTGTGAVVVHAINWFKAKGIEFDLACCIYATAPFIQVERLIEGHDALIAHNKSFAFSVTSFAFPIQRALKRTPDGSVDMFWPENLNKRSQDLEPAYHDAAQFYWGKTEAWLNGHIAFSPVSAPVILPRHLVHDIDTPEDWDAAEVAFEVLKRRDAI